MKTAKLILVLLCINLSAGCVRDNGSNAVKEKKNDIPDNNIPGNRDSEEIINGQIRGNIEFQTGRKNNSL